jgi:hypothetical protein
MELIMKPLYKLIFSDNSIFFGGNLYNTKWNEIPRKQIKELHYFLPNFQPIILKDFERYFHMVEVCCDLNGNNKIGVEAIYLMGKKDERVYVFKIDIKQNTIKKILYHQNNNFIKKLNKKMWK